MRWYTADELDAQQSYMEDQSCYDPEDIAAREEAEETFVYPGFGHNPLAEYLATGTLKHTIGVCKCPECAWVWAHVDRADLNNSAELPQIFIGVLKEMGERVVDMRRVDMNVWMEGVGK
jgi:hypothetical protein